MTIITPQIVKKITHDRNSFTQGLALDEGVLYESVGRYGQSALHQMDCKTGKIIKKVTMPSHCFAEGVAVFSSQILQLTWKEQKAFCYQPSSLEITRQINYQGEGWGLCRDGETVWMSNGSSYLTQRDPETFKILQTLEVKIDGKPLNYLNDLECVESMIYANVWHEEWIACIDKKTGEVQKIVDASHLLSFLEKKDLTREDVLNGIAYDKNHQTFYVTGKCWPFIYEIKW